MRWVSAVWTRWWHAYQASYPIDEEIRENHPVVCASVFLSFLVCCVLLWFFEPHFSVRNGLITIVIGSAGCVISALSWVVWRLQHRTMAYALQLLDSPLLGCGVLWIGIAIPGTIGTGFLLFWVIMAQKWARQYAWNLLSACSILSPAVGIMIMVQVSEVVIILSAGSVFFLITAHQTHTHRQLTYGQSRVSDIWKILEALTKRKVIQYHEFSAAMRQMKECTFILRSNTIALVNQLSARGYCDECSAINDIESTARKIARILEQPMQQIADGDESVFCVQDLFLAIQMRRSVMVTIKKAQSFEILTTEDFSAYTMRGDLDVVALAVHSLIDNAWDCGAMHVSIEMQIVKGCLVIKVSDNGPGISPMVQRRLFEPGLVLNRSRTGMGLFFARQAMRFYGGEVELERTGENGSTFVITVLVIETRAHVCTVSRLK